MNKHLLIITLCWLAGFYVKAQDQLFKKDNSKVLVTVIEIGPDAIKYKMADNPNGPVYIISKSDVVMIIYKNGDHEMFNSSKSKDFYVYDQPTTTPAPRARMSIEDSSKYYQYNKNFSINFCNLMNMEVGAMFQADFFKSHIGIVVPMAVGIGKPSVTQSVYFSNTNQYYGGNSNSYILQQKLFEIGLGLNYYPNLKYSVNYYVGPVVKYMQYMGEQTYIINTQSTWGQPPVPPTRLTQKSILNRYTFSITNGFIFRTKSRIMFNIFGSLGFKNDQLSQVIIEPSTGLATSPIRNPVNIYFWGGFNLGFSF
ncbi:MAG: hypothetical protein JNL60_04575 [Bacteroidia bacterium]|nr:hypothetical protein [Bacteroidia bacterium]